MSVTLNVVPARQGAQWVRLGMQVFRKQPLGITGLFFTFIAVVSVLSILPVIGPLLGLTLIPALTAGLMHATHECIKGQFPSLKMLFAPLLTGDKQRRRDMLVLGLLYALCFVGIMGLSMLMDGGTFARLYLVGGKLDEQALAEPEFLAAMYAALACYLPISLAFWHAPALVFWHGLSPAKSIFFSTVTCFKNFGAFTLYGLIWFGWMLGGGLLVSLIGALIGSAATQALMMAAILIVASMFFASIFFTFHDCFITSPAEKTSAAPHESA
jgi:hypothetical protein